MPFPSKNKKKVKEKKVSSFPEEEIDSASTDFNKIAWLKIQARDLENPSEKKTKTKEL